MRFVCRTCLGHFPPEKMAQRREPKTRIMVPRRECLDCFNADQRRKYHSDADRRARRQARVRQHRSENVAHSILMRVKSRAKNHGIPFSLKESDILPLPTHCPVLHVPLSYDARQGPNFNSPSLDRIDPRQGYVPGNVVVVSWRANVLKRDATVKELRSLLEFYSGLETAD
jgi:hypothetical protein